MRYPMQIAQDPIARTAFSLFGINPETAYVELTPEKLVVKEGILFEEQFDLKSLGRAELIPWEWWYLGGLGLRTDFQGTVAPITSPEKVISISLESKRNLFIPLLGPVGLQVPCQKLVFSLRDSDAFLAAFNLGRSSSDGGPTPVTIE